MELYATPEGTIKYAEKFADKLAPSHFNIAESLAVSSIGMGTYLGSNDRETDLKYSKAVGLAVALGCNYIDTAINYRFQRSERAVGMGLRNLFSEGQVRRDEIVISTKGGYIPFDGRPPQDITKYFIDTFLKNRVINPDDLVAGCHCISPSYLENQLECSLNNLGIDCVDIYFIHNPEEQLKEIKRPVFTERIARAFELLENKCAEGKISFYGVATWNGFLEDPGSKQYLSIDELYRIAIDVTGAQNRFKFIQLPINLAMPEAFFLKNQSVDKEVSPLLEAAWKLDINVVASASLLQNRLCKGLPETIDDALDGLRTDAQRALQFARSAPGVVSALVGMSSPEHIEENMTART